MKNKFIKLFSSVFFLACFNVTLAGSNNGYTTAANVYSGSSSRGWYGGGVAHVLSEWKKEKAMAQEKSADIAVDEQEQPSMTEDTISN